MHRDVSTAQWLKNNAHAGRCDKMMYHGKSCHKKKKVKLCFNN